MAATHEVDLQARQERYERARVWGTSREMNPLEALMWRAEADFRMRSTIAAVELLDTVPDWQRLVDAHEWGSRMIARFRQRVAEPALGVGLPAWEMDPRFELERHLRRECLDGDAGLREVLDVAAGVASAPFDRDRPLWEAVLVEGLDGGRAAYVLKLHHSLADGLGNVQLLDILHSDRRQPTAEKPWPALPEPRARDGAGLLGGQLGRLVRGLPGALGRAGRQAGGMALRPRRAMTDAVRLAVSLERLLASPPAPPSPLLEPRSLSWRFEALEVSLPALRAAGNAGGGSLNDAFIAALLSALRRYHAEFGMPVAEIPMAIPVSVRRDADALGGNRFTGLRFAAPVGEADPRRRIALVHEVVARGRSEPALGVLAELAPLIGLLPSPLVARLGASLTQRNDLQASNVPGLRREAYLAGARITHVYPFGPLPGCAAMITLASHRDICCIGANLDVAAFTEPELFARCLREGFAEVLDMGPSG